MVLGVIKDKWQDLLKLQCICKECTFSTVVAHDVIITFVVFIYCRDLEIYKVDDG